MTASLPVHVCSRLLNAVPDGTSWTASCVGAATNTQHKPTALGDISEHSPCGGVS